MRISRKLHRHFSTYDDSGFANQPCPACGEEAKLERRGVVAAELVHAWKLSAAWANWMDQREGLRCLACRSNLRSRQLAEVLVHQLNQRLNSSAKSLKELCLLPEMQFLAVAETNAAGDLHRWMKQLPGLRYSEYGSTDPNIPSEDLHQLSFAQESFDLVLNSDVLEHVPDFEKALTETYRVLKPGGLYIFTVPLIWPQNASRRRAVIQDGCTTHLLPPSFHGDSQAQKADFLVFHEFGADFVDLCQQVGFKLEAIKDSRNPSLTTFVAQRPH